MLFIEQVQYTYPVLTVNSFLKSSSMHALPARIVPSHFFIPCALSISGLHALLYLPEKGHYSENIFSGAAQMASTVRRVEGTILYFFEKGHKVPLKGNTVKFYLVCGVILFFTNFFIDGVVKNPTYFVVKVFQSLKILHV